MQHLIREFEKGVDGEGLSAVFRLAVSASSSGRGGFWTPLRVSDVLKCTVKTRAVVKAYRECVNSGLGASVIWVSGRGGALTADWERVNVYHLNPPLTL